MADDDSLGTGLDAAGAKRLVAPAFEQGAEDDHNANPHCLYTRPGDVFEEEEHADGAQQGGEGKYGNPQHFRSQAPE